MRILVKFLLLMLVSITQAQSPLSYLNSIVSAEEHLIHREKVGPYLLSADGQRLLDEPYLRLDIRYEGEPISADSDVSIQGTLYQNGVVKEMLYTPVHDGERFVIEELELNEAKSWNWDEEGWLDLDFTIDGPAGVGVGSTGFQIFPPKPQTGALFAIVNFTIPFVVLVFFAGIYYFRQVKVRARVVD